MASPFASNRPYDGTRMVIHTHLSRPAKDAKLRDARRNSKYTKLCLTGVLGVRGFHQQAPLFVDRDLAVSLGNLLRCDDRVWERLEVEHCTGEIDVIIAIGMLTGRVQSFWFSEMELEAPSYHALATGLKHNQHAIELRFRRSRLSLAIGVIGDGLYANKIIQSISLEQCGIVDGLLAGFVASLRECNALQKLSLEGNICRSMGTRALDVLLREKRIQSLNLHNQRIEGDERLDVSPLANALRMDQSALRFLDLSRNCLNDSDVSLLMSALLDNNQRLETLHLDQNAITDEGARVVAEALPSLAALRTLALPENPFGEAGAAQILEAMRSNYILEVCIIPSGISQLQKKIRWYGNLNKGGRRLFSTPRDAARSLYPLVIERVNTMPLSHDWNPEIAPADVIYGLLRLGQLLFEQEQRRRRPTRRRISIRHRMET
jgi:Leucine Rich repeat